MKRAGLTKNMYYEIKDVVVEDRMDGVHAYKHKIRTKVYGVNNDYSTRKELIDILTDRVKMHKDKIVSPIIYNELLGMEIKKNGRIEHSAVTHDDQVFSMLMALYVWYCGTNLSERYGLRKTSIRTDEDIDDEIPDFNPETMDISQDMVRKDSTNENIEDTLKIIQAGKYEPYGDFLERQRVEEYAKFIELLNTPLGEKAFRTMYNIPRDQPIAKYLPPDAQTGNGHMSVIPDSVFADFYKQTGPFIPDTEGPTPGAVPASDISQLGSDYDYFKMFNF